MNWLFTNVAGFADRREARKYASQMLKVIDVKYQNDKLIIENCFQAGFVRHTVNKSSFSEQCYYTFGDIASALQSCNIKVMYQH